MKAILLLLSILFCFSCTPKPAEIKASSPPASARLATRKDNPTELPLPTVPSTITDPKARAEYALCHFWDRMDFTDHSLSLDTAFMEQSFANFAGLTHYADSAAMADAVDSMMSRAEKSAEARDFISTIVERYLNNPDSPMRDEETYIHFLRRDISSPALSDAEKQRAGELLRIALKNRPGTIATDFSMTDRNGRQTRLLKTVGQHKGRTIVVFYDPDCDNCKIVMGQMGELKLPGDVRVLAVDAEGDRGLWEASLDELPEDWVVGFATDPVLDDELYVLLAMPTLYLLDQSGRVILKDPTLSELVNSL